LTESVVLPTALSPPLKVSSSATGASLTGFTVMATESESTSAGGGVRPRSLVVTTSESGSGSEK
jgi:hypothetical protein